jgi:hypothetical protein
MKWFILFALVAFAFAQEEATGDLGEENTADLGGDLGGGKRTSQN